MSEASSVAPPLLVVVATDAPGDALTESVAVPAALPVVLGAPEFLPAVLPSVAMITSPRVSLEVIAIAAGVFALVQCFVWIELPSELLWLAVLGLAINRRSFYERGQDLVFARPRRRVSANMDRTRGDHAVGSHPVGGGGRRAGHLANGRT